MLSVLVVGGTFVFVLSPGIVSATSTSSGSPQVCGPCPPGEYGCGPAKCLPDCSPYPVIDSHQASAVQDGFRQVWVNWTYNSGSPAFYWSSNNFGTDLPVPALTVGSGSASVNLNALSGGTTYQYEVTVTNSCGTATADGLFSTSSPPSGNYVGWVTTESMNVHYLDPMGSPIQGASVGIYAQCPGEYTYFFGGTTDSSGHYDFGLPLTVNLGDGEYYVLASGYCNETATSIGTVSSTALSQYALVATFNGDWNITRNVSATLSAPNDFQQFALPSNSIKNVPIGLSLIHTTYAGVTYNNTECGIEFTQGSTTSQVSTQFFSLGTQFFGLSGGSSQSYSGSSGTSWSAPGIWGSDTGISLGYPFSGFATTGNLNRPENAFTVGAEEGVAFGPYTTTDWLSAPPAFNGSIPTGYKYATVIPAYDSQTSDSPLQTVFDSGTFTQATQLEASLSIPFAWDGISGALSFKLSNSIAVSTTLGWTVGCHFYNPIDPAYPTYDALFYYFNADTGVSSTVVHTWFMGWCAPTIGESLPECPGGP